MVVVRAGSKSASWVLGLLLALPACGFEGDLPTTNRPPGPPVPPAQAQIALTLSASPIDAVVGVDGTTAWSALWTLNVRETAGIGGNIDFVRATLADANGASIAEAELDAELLTEQVGSNRLQGGSAQDIPMDLHFDFPADVLSGNLHVDLQVSDDRGNTVSAAADDVVRICVPTPLAPLEATIMDNGCANRENGILWEFDWSDCAGATSYQLYVKQRNEQEPAIDRPALASSTYTVLQDQVVPEDIRRGWFWKVRAEVNGVLGDWSPETNFDVEPVNTDCVRP